MNFPFLPVARNLLVGALLTVPALALAQAPSFDERQREAIEQIFKNYLLKNPELLRDAMVELERREQEAQKATQQSALKESRDRLVNSSRDMVAGNAAGDITLVEFFDYNCGYCKRALSDMLNLMKEDPKLRVVLKEFPVLGPGSVEAAQVAVAVRMQDPTGKKYLEFHQKLLGGRGQADRAHALAVAKEIGLDMARIEKDMAGDEAKATLEENMHIAEALGLNGTPSYVIGTEVVVGAVGLAALKEKVGTARQ
jgi:protein-disulfide isomerase